MHQQTDVLTRLNPRRWFAMIPMLLGVFLGAVTISSATTALPSMITELSLSTVEATWIIDAYPLALAVSLVVAARTGDRFGRRRMMILGFAGFAAFNLVGGFAQSGLALIAARTLLGFAEALVIASVVATIGVHFRARERVFAYGLWTATFGAGSALGPLIGGLLSDGPGWRWTMYAAAPVAAAALVLAAWLVPESRTSTRPSWDFASIALSIVALAGIVYGLQHAALAPVTAAFVGVTGVVALVLFVRRQRRLHDPLIDVNLFANGRFSVAYLQILVTTGTSNATVFLVSLHLQQTRGYSAIEAGITLLPHAALIVIGGVLAPLTLRIFSSGVATALALIAQASGLIWMSVQPENFIAPLVLIGLGMGVVGTLSAAALFDVTTSDQAGQVGAIQEVGFALGAGLGIAVFGAIAAALGINGFSVAFVAAAVTAAVAGVLPVSQRSRRRRLPDAQLTRN